MNIIKFFSCNFYKLFYKEHEWYKKNFFEKIFLMHNIPLKPFKLDFQHF